MKKRVDSWDGFRANLDYRLRSPRKTHPPPSGRRVCYWPLFMPRAARSPCCKPGCGRLADGRYCDVHQGEDKRQADQERGSSTQRGYGYRWQKYRARYLAAHPLCVACEIDGRVTAATVVDHIKPHRGDPKLMWNPANHQGLCKPHHDIKTATQDGAFGRPRTDQG